MTPPKDLPAFSRSAAARAVSAALVGAMLLWWPAASHAQAFIVGARIDIPAGNGPFAIAIGDLNNDGNPDLAVGNGTNGTFNSSPSYGSSGRTGDTATHRE